MYMSRTVSLFPPLLTSSRCVEILCWMLQLFNLYNYKMLMRFYVGCFNYLNIYNYKMKMMIWKESTTKWFQIQSGGHNPSCLYKKILAGNLYCSPSPPHFVAEIWRWIYIYMYITCVFNQLVAGVLNFRCIRAITVDFGGQMWNMACVVICLLHSYFVLYVFWWAIPSEQIAMILAKSQIRNQS